MKCDWAIREPHYSFKDLAHLDDRLEALEIDESGEVFTAAVIAFESEDGQRVDEVVKVAIEASDNWRALISAVGWLYDENYRRWIPGLLTANDLSYRRLVFAGSVIRRQDSESALDAALDDPELNYQARAIRAVGELKRCDLLPVLQQKLTLMIVLANSGQHGQLFYYTISLL